MKYLVSEANNILTKDTKNISKYLDRQNLLKDTIPNYEYTLNGVNRIASFQKIDYFTNFKQEVVISEPFSYHEFKLNPGRTHAELIKCSTAFNYILQPDNVILRKLNMDAMYCINKQTQIIIVAYVKKGVL